jgi:N utilization substance protein B
VGKRRKAREIVLQALYESEFSDRDQSEILADLVAGRSSSQETMEYAEALLRRTKAELAGLDEKIKSALENWDIERLSLVDRNILRFALAEILFSPEVPGKVIIDEAIEIANKYSSADAGRLINGVLDSFLKKYRKDEVS